MKSPDDAWALFTEERYDEAQAMFRDLLSQHLPATDTYQRALFGLGYCLAFSNQFDAAREIFQTLRLDAAQSGDRHAEHRALHQIGMVERMAGHWEAAQACFQQEHTLIASLGDAPWPCP